MARRAFAYLVLVLLLTAGCGGSEPDRAPRPSGPRLSPAVARDLDALLRRKVEETGVPGASAAVVFPDGRTWSGAAGLAVLEPARPMTSRTSLPFASATKIATASLAMRLVEQGRPALDDPVRRWYPAWRGDAKATVRDLLGHTSGLGDPPDAFFERLTLRSTPTARDHIAATAKPGPRTTDAEYSNTGYMIAGLALSRAAGEPVAAAMRRELFGHPGGDGLALQPAELAHPPHAHSYWYPHGEADPVDLHDGGSLLPFRGEATMGFTAGELAGDVPSLARWGHELLGGRILAPESLREMTRFHDGALWGAYGLGVARSSEGDHEVWGHGGEMIGSTTELWHLPRENLTIAITWNDDLFGREGQAVPALLRVALGSE